jgi:tetratricopeptide (TPR) repeat protein
MAAWVPSSLGDVPGWGDPGIGPAAMEVGAQTRREPRADEVLAAVERITAGRPFAQSERLTRFLRFIVERRLEGRSDEIKELVLATEVFDRTPDFDPRESTIVRTEARRLRQRLEDYYATEGREDPVRIELPKGAYVPVFRWRGGRSRSGLVKVRVPVWRRAGLAVVLVVFGAWLAWQGWWRYGPLFPAEEVRLAVLPFGDLSGDSAEAYFSYGVREELVGDWRVISRLRPMAVYAPAPDRQKNTARAGADLRASHVVEGAVRRNVNQVSISLRVTELPSGKVAREEHATGDVSALPRICADLALRVARGVGVRVPAEERRQLGARGAVRADSILFFWRGLYHFRRFTPGDIAAARDHFERAVAIDPVISWAWAMLAHCYFHLADKGGVPPAEAARKAEEAAGHAVALDAAAHIGAKGMVSGMLQWKWSAASQELTRNTELQPNSALAHNLYAAYYLLPMGRFNEALAAVDRALQLEPQDGGLRVVRANILLGAGQTREAIAEAEKAGAPGVVARARALAGDYDEALAIYRKHGSNLEAAWVWALAGRRAEARRAMTQALPIDSDRLTSLRAAVYAALGEKATALDLLEKAFDRHEVQLAYLNVDPRFAGLRPHPRFQALLGKIGLSQGSGGKP